MEHSDGGATRIPLTPDRPVGEVTREVLEAVRRLAGAGRDQPDPSGGALDDAARRGRRARHLRRGAGRRRTSPRRPRPRSCSRSSGRPTAGARRRSTPGGEPSTSPVSLFSGRPADPPSDDFIMRNAGDAQQVEIGWWPGDREHGRAAFFAFAYPAPDGLRRAATLDPDAAHWDAELGEYILDWDDVAGRSPIRTPSRSSSRGRHFATRAPRAAGILTSRRAPRATPSAELEAARTGPRRSLPRASSGPPRRSPRRSGTAGSCRAARRAARGRGSPAWPAAATRRPPGPSA